jgi:predicted ATPase
VELFVERAQAVRPDFVPAGEELATIAQLCQRLDGLPLAIELAAARVRLFLPAALLARLEASGTLPLLTGGARDLPARQLTLRATLDWSYQLLSGVEQTLLARLGVFVGEFTIAAVEAVAGVDALATLEVLVAHSMVQVLVGSAHEPRFGLLETVREYALEQLERRGEAHALRERHAAYICAVAEVAAVELREPGQLAWLDQLERDYANIIAALEWCLHGDGSSETGLKIAGALYLFWLARGRFGEGRAGWSRR